MRRPPPLPLEDTVGQIVSTWRSSQDSDYDSLVVRVQANLSVEEARELTPFFRGSRWRRLLGSATDREIASDSNTAIALMHLGAALLREYAAMESVSEAHANPLAVFPASLDVQRARSSASVLAAERSRGARP